MSFESLDNRAIIWTLLQEAQYFSGFPASIKDDVKRLLDNIITMVAIQKTSLTLPEKNKEVLSQMFSNRDLFVNSEIKLERVSNSQTQNLNGRNDTTLYTAEGLREIREQEFSQKLEQHKDQFDTFINQGRPDEIDFRDKVSDVKIGGDMERLIALEQERRMRDLEGVKERSDNPDEVAKWVNGGRSLKIEHETTLPVESEKLIERRVRFEDETKTNKQEIPDIFSKLKTKPVVNQESQIGKNLIELHKETLSKVRILEEKVSKLDLKIETLIKTINDLCVTSKEYSRANETNSE